MLNLLMIHSTETTEGTLCVLYCVGLQVFIPSLMSVQFYNFCFNVIVNAFVFSFLCGDYFVEKLIYWVGDTKILVLSAMNQWINFNMIQKSVCAFTVPPLDGDYHLPKMALDGKCWEKSCHHCPTQTQNRSHIHTNTYWNNLQSWPTSTLCFTLRCHKPRYTAVYFTAVP